MNRVLHLIKKAERFTVDNSPLILTGVGVAGTITTALLTAKATVKATRIVDDWEKEEGTYEDPRKRLQERVRLVWPYYIPPVGVMTITVVSIIGANRIGARRAAAIATAYTLSEKAFEDYRDKIVDKFGEKKSREVHDEIMQDNVKKNPPKQDILLVSDRDITVFDNYSKRYFSSTMEKIKKAQNDINYRIINHDFATLNEFYREIGLESIMYGEEIGWSNLEKLEITFTAVLAENDKPVMVIDFRVEPVRSPFPTF